MSDNFFVCVKDCTFAGQRWYPGDKMPSFYAKDGICPKYFTAPAAYKELKKKEAEEKHVDEVKNRIDAMMTNDPTAKRITQNVLNKTLGTKKAKVPDEPLANNWKTANKPVVPKVAGPQPGSLIEKRGPGRPPKDTEDK